MPHSVMHPYETNIVNGRSLNIAVTTGDQKTKCFDKPSTDPIIRRLVGVQYPKGRTR